MQAGKRGQQHCRGHEPDQIEHRHDLEQQPGAEAAGDERGRTPQPHRAIAPPEAVKAAQRIGVGERHDRGVERGRKREGDRNGERSLRQSNGNIAQNRRCGGDHDGAAQGIVPIGGSALRAGWRAPARASAPPAPRRWWARRVPWPRARPAGTAAARRARGTARRKRSQAATQRLCSWGCGRASGDQPIEQLGIDVAAGKDGDGDLAPYVDLA